MFTNNFRLALKTGLSLAPHGHPGDSTSISFIVNRTGRFTAGADAISSPVDANGNPLEAPLRARGGGDGPIRPAPPATETCQPTVTSFISTTAVQPQARTCHDL